MISPFAKDLASKNDSAELSPGLVRRTLSAKLSMPPASAELVRLEGSHEYTQESGEQDETSHLHRQGSLAAATDWRSVFNMVNGVLGAGVLGYPYCYKLCGFVLTTCLLLLCFGVCQLTQRFLLECSQITGKRTYESVGRACVGPLGEYAVKICISVLNVGALVAYINIISDILSSVAGTMIPPALEPSRKMVMVGVALLALLPIGLAVTDPARLSSLSSVSVGIIAVFAIAMCFFALSPIQNANPIKYFRIEGIAIAFPVIGYGFAAHTVLFPVYNTMKLPCAKSMQKVITWAGIVNASIYFMVGTMGYVTFRQRVHGDVLRNLGFSPETTVLYEAFQYMLKVGYGASIMGCVPLVLMPLHTSFFFLIDPRADLDARHGSGHTAIKNSITVAVIFLALALAIMVPNVEFIFGLVGATATVMIAYILPSLFYVEALQLRQSIKWTAQKRQAVALCIGIILFGASIAFLGTRATLTAVKEEAEVVQLASKLVQQTQVVKQAEEASKKVTNVAEAVKVVDAASRDINAAQQEADQAVGHAQKAAQVLQRLEDDQKPVEFWDIKGQLDKMTGQSEDQSIKEVTTNLKSVSEKVKSTVKNLESLTKNLEQNKQNVTATTDTAKQDARLPTQEHQQAQTLHDVEEIEQKQQKNSVEDDSQQHKQEEDEEESKEARALEIAQDLAQAKQAENAKQSPESMTEDQLAQVQLRANMTLQELKRTAAVLTQLETAAQQLLEIRQGKQDPEAKKEAVELLRSAITQTLESSRAINTTKSLLKGIAQTQTSELLKLLLNMARDVSEQADQKLMAQQQATIMQSDETDNDNINNTTTTSIANSTQSRQQGIVQIEETSRELVQQLVQVAKLVEGGINLSQIEQDQNMTWLVAAADAAKDAAQSTASSAKQEMKATVKKESDKQNSKEKKDANQQLTLLQQLGIAKGDKIILDISEFFNSTNSNSSNLLDFASMRKLFPQQQ